MEESYEDAEEPPHVKMLSDVRIFSIDNEHKKYLKSLIAEKYIGKSIESEPKSQKSSNWIFISRRPRKLFSGEGTKKSTPRSKNCKKTAVFRFLC